MRDRSSGRGAVAHGPACRLLCAVLGVSLLGAACAYGTSLSLYRGERLNDARRAARQASGVVETSIEHAMLHDDRSLPDALVGSIIGQGAVETIRLLDGRGVVRLSSAGHEVGSTLSASGPACEHCHHQEAGTASPEAVLSTSAGREVLVVARPIANRPACRSCHDPQDGVLGVLFVESPTAAPGGGGAAGMWPPAVVALATLAVIGGSATVALRPFRPREGQTLALLDAVGVATGKAACSGDILKSTVDAVVGRLGCRAGALYLRDETTARLRLAGHTRISKEGIRWLEERLREWGDSPHGDAEREPGRVRIIEMGGDAGRSGFGPRGAALCWVMVPLWSEGRSVGLLGLVCERASALGTGREPMLRTLGHEVGIAAGHAVLLARARKSAALKERERIARELHDRFAQALAYLSVRASLMDGLLEEGRVADVRGALKEMGGVIREALADLREAVFGLRLTARDSGGFLDGIRECLAATEDRYGVMTHLEVEAMDGHVCLAPAAQAQVLYALQEALANAARHSGGRHITVRLGREGDAVRVVVADDGNGFCREATARTGRRGFGIAIMRERLEAAGGHLEVVSAPGRGTRVVMTVPGTREVDVVGGHDSPPAAGG